MSSLLRRSSQPPASMCSGEWGRVSSRDRAGTTTSAFGNTSRGSRSGHAPGPRSVALLSTIDRPEPRSGPGTSPLSRSPARGQPAGGTSPVLRRDLATRRTAADGRGPGPARALLTALSAEDRDPRPPAIVEPRPLRTVETARQGHGEGDSVQELRGEHPPGTPPQGPLAGTGAARARPGRLEHKSRKKSTSSTHRPFRPAITRITGSPGIPVPNGPPFARCPNSRRIR